MRTALWLLLAALTVCAPASAQTNTTWLLSGFEDETAPLQWDTQGASVERVSQNATQGRWALQVTFGQGRYPGLLLERGSPLLTGWDNYDFLRLDVFNPQPDPVGLTVRVDDAESMNFGSRYNEGFIMRPGKNTIELAVHRLRTSDHKRNLDASRLKQFMIFASDVRSPLVLFLDNLRLEKSPPAAGNVAIRAFDFGPRGSPVMEGFVAVSEADLYDKARGWGWIAPHQLASFDDELPDSLCRDYVGPVEGAAPTNTFVMDVPNGSYQVVECTRDLHAVDPYRGIDHDWWPGKDVWKEEILPKFPEDVSRTTVTNGQIAVTFTNVAVYWLAIVPSADDWLAALNAARRREFYEKYFYIEPYKVPTGPSHIKLAAARGQTVSATFTGMNPLAMSSWPFFPGCTVGLRAVRLMERPVDRGVYHIEEMALVSYTNRLHAQRFAVTVSVSKDAKPGLYRTGMGGIPVELRIWPFELPPARDVDMTFGWYYDPSDDPAMRDCELRDMVEHGFDSVTPLRPTVRCDGSLDTERADEFLDAAMQAGVINSHPVPIETLVIARRLSYFLGVEEFSEQFLPMYQEALAEFGDWASRKPFPVLAYVVDEPREQALNDWNRNFADTKRYLELHRAVGLRTLVTLSADDSFGKSYLPLLDLLDVVSTHPTASSRRILDVTREGKPELWLYNAGMNRVTFGFLPWAIGAKGRWEWHYSSWTQAYDPFTRTSENPWSTGTGAVMPSPDGPLSTVAYENVRAGIDDYRYLWMLERLVVANPRRGTDARRFLEELRGRVPRYAADAAGIDEATMDAWREKIAGFIVGLAGEAERNRDIGSGRLSDPPQRP